MDDEGYSFARARARFTVAAVATAVVGLVGGWSARTAVRRGVVVGAAVATADFALSRFVGRLPEIEAELDDHVEEIEVQIEDAAAEE